MLTMFHSCTIVISTCNMIYQITLTTIFKYCRVCYIFQNFKLDWNNVYI